MIEVNVRIKTAFIDGVRIKLGPVQAKLLDALRDGRQWSREALIEVLAGEDTKLDNALYVLRKNLKGTRYALLQEREAGIRLVQFIGHPD